jgi:23S rRNA (uridine2552-2'-O)-methyltransferase
MTKPYIVKDTYFQKAKEEDLRARSAFKLDEIQQKFKLVKPGQTRADLGAAPGSWSQRLSQWVKSGKVIAMDLQAMEPIASNVELHQGDMFDPLFLNKIFIQKVEGVVADLAPKTTGIPDADAFHSAELNEAVLDFCEAHLKPGGYVITKIFQGEEFAQVVGRAKKLFRSVHCFKPKACRDRSRETYIVGTDFKGRRP